MKRNKKFYKEKKLRKKVKKLNDLAKYNWLRFPRIQETVKLKHPIHTGWKLEYYYTKNNLITKDEIITVAKLTEIVNKKYSQTSFNTDPWHPEICTDPLYSLMLYKTEYKSLSDKAKTFFTYYKILDVYEISYKYNKKYRNNIKYRIIKLKKREVPVIYPDKISEYNKLRNYLSSDTLLKYDRLIGIKKHRDDYKRKLQKKELDQEMYNDIIDRNKEIEFIEETPYWILAHEKYKQYDATKSFQNMANERIRPSIHML